MGTEPDDRTVIDSPDKVKELLVSAYPQAHYMLFAEFMSDNTEDKGSWLYSIYPRRQEEAYNWEVVSEETQDTPDLDYDLLLAFPTPIVGKALEPSTWNGTIKVVDRDGLLGSFGDDKDRSFEG